MKKPMIPLCALGFVLAVVASLFVILAEVEEMEAVPAVTRTCVVETVTPTEPVEESKPVEKSPKKELYDVPLDDEIQFRVIQLCEVHHINSAIVIAMIQHESNFNVNNIGDNGNSFGLMQVQPRWHYQRMQELGCTDLLDPYQNVSVGVDYLAELLDRYGTIDKALTAYNRGHYNGTVSDYAKKVIKTAGTLKKKGAN